MRSFASSLAVLSLAVSLAAGCTAPTLEGPRTVGDRGRTAWWVSDGLCGGGLFGTECALTQSIALGASPTVLVHERDGASLAGATLVADGGSVSNFRREVDDDGHTHLSAEVRGTAAGTVEIRVLDASGNEIDRSRIGFTVATRITCGALDTSVVRELDFAGLTSDATVTVVADADGRRATTLACRAEDASGTPLLAVDAIDWAVDGGTEGVSVESDVLFPVPPARGATARVVVTATEPGTARVVATLGEATDDVTVTF